MKQIYYFLFLTIFTVFLNSCQKETTSNNNNQSNSNSTGLGKYSGVVYVKTIKTPARNTPAVWNVQTLTINSSKILTVDITKQSNDFYLDNQKMLGGPNIFTLNNSVGNFVLDFSKKSITFSNSKLYVEAFDLGNLMRGNYDVSENQDGVLNN